MNQLKMERMPFEEALTMTGFGRFNFVTILLTTSIIAAMAFETVSVAYLVPASACELKTSSAQQGLMAGMPLFGILAMSNIWGYLADTKGRQKILLLSLVLGFINGVLATLSPNWIVFSILKFLSSSAMAGTYGLGITFLSESTPEKKRFPFVVLITSMFLVSVGCMAALTIPILPLKFSYYIPYLDIYFNSWRLLNFIYSLPCAIGAVSLIFALESPRYLLSAGKDGEALEVLKNIYVINTGSSADNYKVTAVFLDEDSGPAVTEGLWSSVVAQTVPLFKPPLLFTTLLLSALFVAVYICIHPHTVWLPFMIDGFIKSMEKGDEGLTFCERMRSGHNETTELKRNDCSLNDTAMIMVFSMDILLAVFNGLLCILIPCCGRKSLLIVIQLVAGCSALIMNSSTVWFISAGLIVVYIAGALNFGFLATFSVDLFPTYVKAMGVCLTLMVGRGSAVLGVNIMKELLVNNCELSFYLFGSITIFGGILGFLLPSEKKKVLDT